MSIKNQNADYMPVELRLYIGGDHGPSYSVVWDGEAIVYTFRKFSRSEAGTTIRIVPTEADWRKFWKQMDIAKVWEWDECYRNQYVMDGTVWGLTLRQAGATEKSIATSGSNAYPDEQIQQGKKSVSVFKKYLTAVSTLLGKQKFA